MRLYELPLVATAYSAAIDLGEINWASAKGGLLAYIRFGQNTELGDAAEEQIPVTWVTGHTTSGSGGNSSVTPNPLDLGDSAFGGTCETFNTTQATGGTSVIRPLGVWNVRTEFLWMPPPEARIWVPGGTRGVVRLPAPTDSITIQPGVIGFAEFG